MKRVSSDYIINRLLSEFGYKNISKNDIYEYIGNAIQQLGYGLFETVEYKQFPISFYKIAYPCDSIKVLNVYYKGKLIPPKTCRNYNNVSPFGWLEEKVVTGLTHLAIEQFDNLQFGLDREKLLAEVIDSFSVIEKQNRVIVDESKWIEYKETHIGTSIEEGNGYLEYTTFALDENGVPLLHDEIHYLNAILYYCSFILIQSGYVHPTINYMNALELKDMHFGKALNYERRMTEQQRESFKNTWTNVLNNSTQLNKYSN